MRDFAYKFIARVRQQAKRKSTTATVKSAGKERVFVAYDWGTDTFIFERDVWKLKPQRAPVLIVRKDALIDGREGRIMTVTSGSHSVAAIPLLNGMFWNLGRVADKTRSSVMTNSVICSNIVGDNIEISQRDISTAEVHAADEWLRGLGWSLSNIVLAERTDGALDFYRRIGQEWRIKPLVWTRSEMDFALAAAQTRIHSDFVYYHSVKGVHFLAYPDFAAVAKRFEDDFAGAAACIDELVKPSEVGDIPALRDPKFRNHHEIELFGIRDRNAVERIVKMLEDFDAELPGLGKEAAVEKISDICALYKSSLSFPDLADKTTELFVQSMYRHLSGEVYSGMQDQIVPAFDDKKTALPGVTYRGGKPDPHPGADDRTLALLEYVHSLLSEGEIMEYANVYELRLGDLDLPTGKWPTREIDFKTNRRPISVQLIEKRLAHHGIEYANYMLVRVQAFQALGIAYGDHHLLARQERATGDTYFFVRNRYHGYAINSISNIRFKRPTGENGAYVDFPESVLATAWQIGRAGAMTLTVKKYIPGPNPVHFGEGKEIVEFGFDMKFRCEMPVRIHLSSIRGSLGWPCIDKTSENIAICFETYAEAFADTIVQFWHEHSRVVTLDEVISNFNEGFAACSREIYWNYMNHRELFTQFDPGLRAVFKFQQKWPFALWAIEQQFKYIDKIKAIITVASGKLATAPINV